MQLSWGNLIERAKANDQEAYYQLYQNSYDAVYRTAKSMIRDDDTAMDVVQDAFVKGFSNLSALDNPDSFIPWMRRIAANKATDRFRKKQEISFSQLTDDDGNDPDFEDDRVEDLPEEVIDRNETARLIDEILNGLSDEQRIAIGMFYFQNMSVAEIAEELSVSENTVKSRLNYGRKRIRASVEELAKKGTKLYSLSPTAFLVFLFRNQIAGAAVGGAPEAAFGTIMAKTGAALGGAASAAAGAEAVNAAGAVGAVKSVGTAGAAGTAKAVGTAGAVGTAKAVGTAGAVGTAKAVGTAGAAAVKTGFFSTFKAKLITGLLAVAVAGSAVGVGLYASRNSRATRPLGDLTEVTETKAVTKSPAAGGSTSVTESVPVTEREPEPEPEPETDLVVLSEEYEELKTAAVTETAGHHVVSAKKNGKWGVIDETGKVLVPFEYDWMGTVTASGHILASQNGADNKRETYTVFDAEGNEILKTDKNVLIGTNVAIIFENSYQSEYNDFISFDRIEVINLSTGETVLTEEYVWNAYNNTFEDCFSVLSVNDPESDDYSGYLTFYNSKGEILRRDVISGERGGAASLYAGTPWDGYFLFGNIYSMGGVHLEKFDGTEEYSYGWDISDGAAGYEYSDRVGPILLLWHGAAGEPSGKSKQYLLDIRTLPGYYEYADVPNYFLTAKGYDYISINALDKWFLVYDGEKQGFLSRDGKTERLFDRAGDFVRGKAIVMDGGEIYIIDDNFNVISDKLSGDYTAVETLDENLYGVEKDGKWYLAVHIDI